MLLINKIYKERFINKNNNKRRYNNLFFIQSSIIRSIIYRYNLYIYNLDKIETYYRLVKFNNRGQQINYFLKYRYEKN